MQVVSLTALALRELWISFRLLLLLGLALAGGMLAAALPQIGGGGSATLAWAMAVTGIITASLAGAALADERQRGRAAWLVVRAVPRSSLVIAWFVALAVPVVVGLTVAAALTWLTVEVASLAELGSTPLDAAAFSTLIAAATLGVLQALAAGLLLGTLARPLVAAPLAGLLSAALLLPPLLFADLPRFLPGSGLGLLARAEELSRPLSDGLGSLGLGCAILAALLILAAAFLERAEL
jgi:hypothetical protein